MESQTIQCSQACTVTVRHEFESPLFSISAAEGAQIAYAIALVWVVGFAVRQIVRLLKADTSTEKDD